MHAGKLQINSKHKKVSAAVPVACSKLVTVVLTSGDKCMGQNHSDIAPSSGNSAILT